MAIHPTYISLFSGAGGLELAVRLALPAAQCVCYVEREVEAAEILAARIADKALDDAPIWSDVSTFDGKPWRGLVDGIVGGFPCQDLSVAGKRGGIKRGNRSGLFFQYARIIREVQPRWVYIENVPPVLAFPAGGIVLGELAGMGFDAQWGTLRASDVGASHRRKRCFVLAYRRCSDNERRRIFRELFGAAITFEGKGHQRQRIRSDAGDGRTTLAHSGSERRGESAGKESAQRAAADHGSEKLVANRIDRRCGEEGRLRCATDGVSAWSGEWMVPGSILDRLRDPQGACIACCGTGNFYGRDEDGDWINCDECRGAGHFVLANPGCDAVRRCTECTEEIGRRPCAEVAGSGTQLGNTDDSGLEGRRQLAGGCSDERLAGTSGSGMVFAPGPAADIWNDLLVWHPEMRPALSQAEVESFICRDVDGLASPLHQRIDRLRACGNGVVPVQGAAALREFMRRVIE